MRDLSDVPHPVLDEAALGALFTPAEQRTPEQAARVALDDALIAEIQAADVVVLGVPMYNFGVPAQLKNWIDAISRAGVTFRYTENGPEGLLKGKKVYVALARGGKYRNTPADTQVPYLANGVHVPRPDRRALRVRRRPGDGARGRAAGRSRQRTSRSRKRSRRNAAKSSRSRQPRSTTQGDCNDDDSTRITHAETVTRPRAVERLIAGQPTSDGAGVKLTRVLTQPLQRRLDPFLMLDAFGTDNPQDYIGGFPDHPHRGFETVTYMIAGRMRHRDSAGHEGPAAERRRPVDDRRARRHPLRAARAGRRPHGRLPAVAQSRRRRTRCARRGIATSRARRFRSSRPREGVKVRVIAGRSHGVDGAMQREVTEPLYLDLEIPAGASFDAGAAAVAQRVRLRVSRRLADRRRREVPVQRMAILANDADSDGVVLKAAARDARAADRRQAARRADRAVRSVRDEHEGRDLPGGAGLPVREVRAGVAHAREWPRTPARPLWRSAADLPRRHRGAHAPPAWCDRAFPPGRSGLRFAAAVVYHKMPGGTGGVLSTILGNPTRESMDPIRTFQESGAFRCDRGRAAALDQCARRLVGRQVQEQVRVRRPDRHQGVGFQRGLS